MISNRFQNEIYSSLNENGFNSADFEIATFEHEDGSINLFVYYRYIDKYKCKIYINSDDITIEMYPGRILLREVETLNELEEIPQSISEWTLALCEELLSAPFVREFEETKEIVRSMDEQLQEIPKTYFTKQESEELKLHLERLQKEFEETIRREFNEKGNLEQQVNEMKADIQQLKQQIELLNKRGWIKSFGTKVVTWSKEHPVATVLLASAGFNFLPKEIQDLLPSQELINTLLPNVELLPSGKPTLKEEVNQ